MNHLIIFLRVDSRRLVYLYRNPASGRFYVRFKYNSNINTTEIKKYNGKVVKIKFGQNKDSTEIRYYLTYAKQRDIDNIKNLLQLCQS